MVVPDVHISERAQRFPDQVAAIDGATQAVTTFGQLDQESKRLAQFWRSIGLSRGDVVAVLMTNSARFLTVTWAAMRSGLYSVPVNWHLTAAEAAYIVANSEARALVVSSDLAGLATEIIAAVNPTKLSVLVVGEPRNGFDSYEEIIAGQPAEALADESQGALMLYSSGTTGRPKGIKPALPRNRFGDGEPMARMLHSTAGLDASSIYLCPAPLYHSAPLGWSLASQSLGATVVVMDRFDAEQTLALIERNRVTHAQFVPTMFSRMLKLAPEVRDRYDLSSLKYVVHAGAPCALEVKEQMIHWLGPIVHEYYGFSEGTCFFTIDSTTWLSHRGSVGKPLLGIPHILDDNGDELGAGEIGQIWIESPIRFDYHGDVEKTAQAFNSKGWSTVGDIGWLDADGYLYLSDRRTDLIIVGGVNVYPREIEEALAAHDSVADVAVIGVPDPEMGQQVKAVVQLGEDQSPSPALEAELIAFCTSKLARVKQPKSITFVAELPRLPSGKLLRRAVRDRYGTTGDTENAPATIKYL
ncbi:acyl-CoA synthetase [[Mycobacterium] wendilense]|uniref:Acyl-CoA synthetase n=1 Tax=[Mycobacterium] wendilense TaxID=3064284 RepID=A0ABN9P4E4_9MYCO|nr:acyl-CoA synthetase [Mycolicibacterium sp. MU0050]CAJ1586848.1 acyl-CoA synthetase [Mycolicibacterium sp. MU0050]